MMIDYFKPRVAILTFTDARDEGISSDTVERHLKAKQEELSSFLQSQGIHVVNPLSKLKSEERSWYGIRNLCEVGQVVQILNKEAVDAVIIGAWTWSPPMFIKEFIRKFPRPLMYYTENDPMAGSLSQFTATCASLMEWSVNKYALRHQRSFGNKISLIRWARGIAAAARMRESALMLWGGTYAVHMDHLQDDVNKLKSFMIRDVLQEDQYILVSRAERIRKEQSERLDTYFSWLTRMGLTIVHDDIMVTAEALQKQAALLLAARDRLDELGDENVRGVSIKCQPEIYSEYGVNACMLPAFLPFPENEEGQQRIYPTVCEGDIKGLLTGMILHALNPEVPPAFGDLVSVDDDHIEFANCGAGSVFWAANSGKASEALKRVEAAANIHGKSGAAFHYFGVPAPEITIARLTRINGRYYMQAGTGRELDSKEFLTQKLGNTVRTHLGGTWGKVVVDLGVKGENFVKVIGANHLHATLGDVTEEIETACGEWNIPVIRLDSDDSMETFYREMRDQGV